MGAQGSGGLRRAREVGGHPGGGAGERALSGGCGGAWLLSERLQGDLGEIRSLLAAEAAGGGPEDRELRGHSAGTGRKGLRPQAGAVSPANVGTRHPPLIL